MRDAQEWVLFMGGIFVPSSLLGYNLTNFPNFNTNYRTFSYRKLKLYLRKTYFRQHLFINKIQTVISIKHFRAYCILYVMEAWDSGINKTHAKVILKLLANP